MGVIELHGLRKEYRRIRPVASWRQPRFPYTSPRAGSETSSLNGVTRFCNGIAGFLARRSGSPPGRRQVDLHLETIHGPQLFRGPFLQRRVRRSRSWKHLRYHPIENGTKTRHDGEGD